jgi:hypothetical protein
MSSQTTGYLAKAAKENESKWVWSTGAVENTQKNAL